MSFRDVDELEKQLVEVHIGLEQNTIDTCVCAWKYSAKGGTNGRLNASLQSV